MALIGKSAVISAINRELTRERNDVGMPEPAKVYAQLSLLNVKHAVENDLTEIERDWIRVEEGMPASGRKVLLYIPEREGCKQHGMYLGEVGEVEADPKGEHNFWGLPTPGSNWRIDGWSYFKEPIVTHWMPLPDIEEIDNDT